MLKKSVGLSAGKEWPPAPKEGMVSGIATDKFEKGKPVYLDPKTGNLERAIISGYAEVFGVEREGDIIQKGAFDDSIEQFNKPRDATIPPTNYKYTTEEK